MSCHGGKKKQERLWSGWKAEVGALIPVTLTAIPWSWKLVAAGILLGGAFVYWVVAAFARAIVDGSY